MKNEIKFISIEPTIFLRENDDRLIQLIRIRIYAGSVITDGEIMVRSSSYNKMLQAGPLSSGENEVEVFIKEPSKKSRYEFSLYSGGEVHDTKRVEICPPRHWVVHIVQLSHHDPGYTDLPSNVLKDHFKWLRQAIEYAEQTESFPDDSRFRIVIEQAWSAIHFLNNAPEELSNKFIDLIKKGRFELTAIFGNMITEICGHEEIIRSLYPSFKLKREHGIEIVSAEHNDITGMSWGLCRILTDAGIKLFCPGLPLYYSWGAKNDGVEALRSFWDQEAIFGHSGPGAFWWEAHTGKRVLLWCNNQGCGGDYHGSLPGMEKTLEKLQSGDYPYSVLRWPVIGGSRDNSPYIPDYSHTIKAWNEKRAYPRLISSTNSMFYTDFIKQVPKQLPVIRGELPGQDYPVGAMSTSAATAQNRRNHSDTAAAEILSSWAEITTDYIYQKESIDQAYEDMLWYDEHAWGFHFPCGPAMEASRYEKEVHAYRAAALAHDVQNKAMAKIADDIRFDQEGYYLVVFNPHGYQSSTPVKTPLREMDNCGNKMYKVPEEGYLRGFLLGNRFHINLPPEYIDGCFELLDMSTSENVAFELIEVRDPMDNIPYAPQRLGIGSGSRRYGFFEIPKGLVYDLCFIAKDLPGNGYKAYKFIPARKCAKESLKNKNTDGFMIENEYYRVSVDPRSGAVMSIQDKFTGSELTDTKCEHGFNNLVIREPELAVRERRIYCQEDIGIEVKNEGISRSIKVTSKAYAHPLIKQEITLYMGIRSIYLSTRILKAPEPLLDVHIAFPFSSKKPAFRYEGVLSVMDPVKDYLPGAYSDAIGIGSWVRIDDAGHSILWSSLDSPVVGFGKLSPGYVSPAHRCLIDRKAAHGPADIEDLDKAWIYSTISNNNFGTNFYVSQTGEMLFRYVITTNESTASDGLSARFGWASSSRVNSILTKRNQLSASKGSLPVSNSIFGIDNDSFVTLAFKKAEDGAGYVLRLWNSEGFKKSASIIFNKPCFIKEAYITDIMEQKEHKLDVIENGSVRIDAEPWDIITIYFRFLLIDNGIEEKSEDGT